MGNRRYKVCVISASGNLSTLIIEANMAEVDPSGALLFKAAPGIELIAAFKEWVNFTSEDMKNGNS